MSYVVKAVAATVLLGSGGRVLLYQGQPVPEGADKDDVERLGKEHYLEKAKVREASGDGPRGGNAGLEKWAAYATSLGLEAPEGAPRDDGRALVAAGKEN